MRGTTQTPRRILRPCVLVAVITTAAIFAGVVGAYAAGTAVFSAPSPANGTAVTTKPVALSIRADDTADVISAAMTVNGIPAFSQFGRPVGHWVWDDETESDYYVVDDASIVNISSYKTAWAVRNGTNTVQATVTSASGVSTYEWTFDYVTTTTIATVTPAPDSTLPDSPSAISVSLSSPYSAFTSSMSLDGVPVATAYASGSKTFTYTPPADLAPGKHTVLFSATANTGTVTRSWRFTVAPPMSSGNDCASCHPGPATSHARTGCTNCHARSYAPFGKHGGYVPTVAGCMGDDIANGIAECHQFDHSGDMGRGQPGFWCTDCHSAANPTLPRHDAPDVATLHETASSGCSTCHSASLIDEHAKYPKTSALKYQCDLCHGANAPAGASAAIASNTTACTTCHGVEGHDLTSHPGGTDAAVRVASLSDGGEERGCSDTYPGQRGCHDISNLGDLHLEAPGSCNICHAAGKTPSTECLTCHPTSASGGGMATETTLASVSWYHHNNVKYLISSLDATPNPYYIPDNNPASGWYDSAYYNDCSDFCHGGYVTEGAFTAKSGERMWYSAPGGAGWSGPRVRTLTSPATTLPTAATLDFSTYYLLTDDWGPGSGSVELSTNGGSSWTTLTGTVNGATTSVLTGDSAAWVDAHYDLSAYAGQEALVRFRFDDGYGYSIGWALDDIVIGGSNGAVLSDGAENKRHTWTSSYWIQSHQAFPPY